MSLIPSRRTDRYNPFSFDSWEPFFNRPTAVVGRSGISSETAAFAKTHIDRRETPEAHVFKVDLPGMRKEELKVEVEDKNVLKISGERRREKEEKGETWHRMERSSGQFSRRFRLPEDAKVEDVKAVMENGFLTVTVPKKEIKKRDFKNININIK